MTRVEQHDFGFAAASPAWLPSAPAPAPWDIAAGTHTNVEKL
jgi:hypothetical protein